MRRLLTAMIGLYRYCVSPFLGNSCRFHPSCSEYAQEAITLHGVLKGCYLGVRRLLRCHPWHPGGVDPVPPRSGLRRSVGVDCGTETTSNPEQHKCG